MASVGTKAGTTANPTDALQRKVAYVICRYANRSCECASRGKWEVCGSGALLLKADAIITMVSAEGRRAIPVAAKTSRRKRPGKNAKP